MCLYMYVCCTILAYPKYDSDFPPHTHKHTHKHTHTHTQMEFTGVNFLMFRQVAIRIPVTLHVCGCGLVISLVDMFKVFEIPTILKEMYHISDIREVSRGRYGKKEREGKRWGGREGERKLRNSVILIP